MSNVSILQNNLPNLPEQSRAVEKLSHIHSKHVQLRISFPAFFRLKPEEKLQQCLKIVTKGYVQFRSSGQSDEDEIATQTQLLLEVIENHFESMTTAEIEMAFYRGIVMRIYGELQGGMCQSTYHQVLAGYFNDKIRVQAWAEYNKKLDELTIKPKSPEQKAAESKIIILAAFKNYKDTKHLGVVPYAMYDLICEMKGVKTLIDDKTRNEIIEKSNQIEKEAQEEQKRLDKYHKSIAKASMELEPKKYKLSPKLNQQKEMALKHYFDQLIKENKELEL